MIQEVEVDFGIRDGPWVSNMSSSEQSSDVVSSGASLRSSHLTVHEIHSVASGDSAVFIRSNMTEVNVSR